MTKVLSKHQDVKIYLGKSESIVYHQKLSSLFWLEGQSTIALLEYETCQSDIGRNPIEDLNQLSPQTYLPAMTYPLCKLQMTKKYEWWEIGGLKFTVETQDKIVKEVFIEAFGHLLVSAKQMSAVDIEISYKIKDSLYLPCFNQQPMTKTYLPLARLVPFVQDRLRTIAYQQYRYLISIHGALLSKDDKTILLCGASGYGKSTLCASLIQDGWTLYSDEITVVDMNLQCHPLPLGLGIKEGSWDVITPIFPSLNNMHIHQRFDGQKIKYLIPNASSLASSGQKTAITHIVFSQYVSHEQEYSTSVSIGETLYLITEAGYQIQDTLEEDKVDLLLQWLSTMPAYQIQYQSLAKAKGYIKEIVNA